MGIKGVIELVVLVGFYSMIAGVIFSFDVPLPEGATDPFKCDALLARVKMLGADD